MLKNRSFSCPALALALFLSSPAAWADESLADAADERNGSAPAAAVVPEGKETPTTSDPIGPMVGVQAGLVAHYADGGAAVGGGSVGIDLARFQVAFDVLYGQQAPFSVGDFELFAIAIGGRAKLFRTKVAPVVGAGASYTAYSFEDGNDSREGRGLGLFADAGLLASLGSHRVSGVLRGTVGLYGEDHVDKTTPSRTVPPLIPFQLGLIGAYGYVF